jgi:photosystem II stability/assembly factor-like uncharacterized protein
MRVPHLFAHALLLACSVGTHAVAAVEAEATPMPAEIAPRADQSLLTAITRAGAQRLVVVGSRGHILLSDDDGAHWRQVASPVNSLLTQVAFLDAQTGWAVGHDATVLKTADGGETWTIRHFDAAGEALLDVMFLDSQRGLALGAYGTLLTSADGGETWAAAENLLTEEGMHLNAIARLNDGRLLIAGETGLVALSPDGGQTWERVEFPYEGSLFAVRPHGERGAIVGGLRGNSLRTTDVATGVWEAIETGSEQSVFGIAAYGDGYALAGFNASVIRVAAGGSAGELQLRALTNGDAAVGGAAMSTEATAFADLLLLDNGELITVGDAGVRRWSVLP